MKARDELSEESAAADLETLIRWAERVKTAKRELEGAQALIEDIRRTLEAAQADAAVMRKHIVDWYDAGDDPNRFPGVEEDLIFLAQQIKAGEHSAGAELLAERAATRATLDIALAEIEQWRETITRMLAVDATKIPNDALRDEIDQLLRHRWVDWGDGYRTVALLLRGIQTALSGEKARDE